MKEERQYEYRILYVAKGSVNASYHYYLAFTPEEALQFQNKMAVSKDWEIETLSIEKKNPFSLKWEDCSEILNK